VDASEITAIGGLVAGVGSVLIGYLATRTKVRVSDVVVVQQKLDEANAALDEEQKARRRDRSEMEAEARVDRAQIEAEHEDRERGLQRRIDVLTAERDQALATVTKLDRVVFAARTYIARLLRVFAERDETPPPRPAELD
jgi:hypothetical protein